MKRHIWLAAMTTPTLPHPTLPPALLDKARAKLAAHGFRFDNRTGTIRDRDGERERLSNPSDHVPAESEEEVMRWQFSRHINNEANRTLIAARAQ